MAVDNAIACKRALAEQRYHHFAMVQKWYIVSNVAVAVAIQASP